MRSRAFAEGAREAGCDAFVTKPCLPDALVAEIQRMLASRDRAEPGRETERPVVGTTALRTRGGNGSGMAKTAKRVTPQKKTKRAGKAGKATVRSSSRERGTSRAATPAPRARGKLERVRLRAQSAKAAAAESAAAASDVNEGQVRLLHHQIGACAQFRHARDRS